MQGPPFLSMIVVCVLPYLTITGAAIFCQGRLTRHFSIRYNHLIDLIIFGAGFPRAASLERIWKDEQKHTPRNIDTQHEGMELHRGCPENVDAERSFRVIRFSITRKRMLLSASRRLGGLAFLPLHCPSCGCFLSRILTHSAPLVCF